MEHQSHAAGKVTMLHEHDQNMVEVQNESGEYLSCLSLPLAELGLGLLMYATDFPQWIDLFIKGVVVILSLAKAFILSLFLCAPGDEIQYDFMTIVIYLILFVWFIAASSVGWHHTEQRNRYDTAIKSIHALTETKKAS